MIKERYCSYELSKLLEEKGFNEEVRTYYQFDNETKYVELIHDDRLDTPNSWGGDYVSAPTHQMACDWLREHGFHINVFICYDYSVDADGNEVDRRTFYTFEISSSFSGELIYTEQVNEYDSNEEAVEDALKYCLTKLI